MNKSIKYSVIIPAYSGQNALYELTERLIAFFSDKNCEYKIILVFDCGLEGTWNIIKKLKSKYPDTIMGIRLTKNFGQHNAIMCGIEYADSEFIITMDEDLQHLPEEISLLIEKQKEFNYDLVYGKYAELKHSFFRNITSRIIKILLAGSVKGLNKDYTSFRIVKTSVAKTVAKMRSYYTFLDGYLAWATENTSSVLVSHDERKEGKSTYTLRKLIIHSIYIFLTFSKIPIILLITTSVLSFLTSFLYAGWIILRKIIYNDLIQGYSSLIVVTTFGTGILLLGIAILGEYLYQINQNSINKPDYLINEVL